VPTNRSSRNQETVVNAKPWLLLVLLLLAVPARAQETVRDLKGPGKFDKFLTPNRVDRWLFEGEKGETLIAHVTSREFDPILKLVATNGKEEKILLDVDDPGTESRFAIRLPEKGKYEIRVHAFEYQGGGNYSLAVQRFQARPLEVGKSVVGTFDRGGKSYFHFQAGKDDIVVPQVKGGFGRGWQLLDFKGRPVTDWAGSVHLDDGGESYLIVSGQPDYRYDLVLRAARRHDLAEGKAQAGGLQQGELDVWSFQGKPGEFRVVEVEKKGELMSRLKYAPLEKKDEQRLTQPGTRLPEIEFLPVASRGGRLRYAVVLGRAGRYQLQLLAESPAAYKLSLADPSVAVSYGSEVKGSLPVGGSGFYTFKAEPGQLFQANLGSQKFVPRLRLYDGHGTLVGSSGDDADALEGHITHMVVKEGLYRLQVSSLGDGGGGDFRLELAQSKLRELTIGGRGTGTVHPGATEFWSFPGKAGQTVFFSVRSTAFEPTVSVRSPDGVRLVADNRGNATTGSLFALKLPRTGRYTVWVAAQRGAGEYTVRLIDGD
jgi:hypothetical protein